MDVNMKLNTFKFRQFWKSNIKIVVLKAGYEDVK
jgi:hypothetical protein